MSVYEGHGVTLHHADCLDVLRSLPDCSVDSVVCDPPYNLSFMAKPWDAYEGREDAGFAYWLSGLIDGEGHFAIKAHSRGTHAPYFQLKMRADERGTLDRIRRLLGVGVVSIESKEPNPMAKYVIQDKAGCQRLVDLLDKYPLRAKKQLDYWTWREAVCEWTSRPRGNRWHGAVDNAQMDELRSRLMENRAYTDVPWSGHEFQDWCRLWATECLRVLKPGAHLLAFGGTRTWHRLACAVEDAGFEVRDSIAWLYGSGFPKSLDVSKAIDKRRHDGADIRRVTAWVAATRTAAGVTNRDIDAAFGFNGMAGHWTTQGPQAAIPTLDHTPALLAVLGISVEDVPDEIRALLIDLNGMKGQPGPAWFAREITQAEARPLVSGETISFDQRSSKERERRDIPATPDAERWQGWGTALKPSFEGIVCATKPVPALARIGSRLDELEQSCIPPASGAVPSSAPTHPDSLGARAASAPASAAIRREAAPARTTPTGAAGCSSAATATSASELTGATFWNTVTSWKACWAELCEATSTSTTGTTSSTTTDLETLWSCLSQITPESTTTDPTSPDGLSSLVGAVDAMFAAAVLNSRATRTLTAIGSATSGTPPTSPAAGGSRAAFEPIVVARKPLTGTVAANVLSWGTGALNVDGCRIEGGERPLIISKSEDSTGILGNGLNGSSHGGSTTAGRWPANVALDESQAAALDEQSGESRDGTAVKRNRSEDGRAPYEASSYMITDRSREDQTYGGQGGASRFFYVAKADATERPRVNGTAHPTVKPLSLMRWLVRLVTPPGGTVLEPFAGSGTTVEACIIEGFQCIAIEREADYLPLIRQRIDRRRDPVEALRGQAADLGLFDLLGGEGA